MNQKLQIQNELELKNDLRSWGKIEKAQKTEEKIRNNIKQQSLYKKITVTVRFFLSSLKIVQICFCVTLHFPLFFEIDFTNSPCLSQSSLCSLISFIFLMTSTSGSPYFGGFALGS